jgi:cobalt/nickel transport protein
MKTMTKLWIGLGVLAVLSPLGLYLPQKFKAGDAWGEWDGETIKGLVGYIPKGFEKLASLWNAIFPDYTFKGWEGKGLGHSSFAYIFSAIVGMAIIAGAVYLIGKLLAKKKPKSAQPDA